MISKAATQQMIINIGRDLIVVNAVKGDDTLHRIMINSIFKGYIQKTEEGFKRVDGCDIHELIFARLCTLIK